MTADDAEHPSIRKALFGNGHVANFRCAVKYTLWGLTYVLVAAATLSVIGTVKLFRSIVIPFIIGICRVSAPAVDRVTSVLEQYRIGSRIVGGLGAIADGIFATIVGGGILTKRAILGARDYSVRAGQFLRAGRTGTAGMYIALVITAPIAVVAIALTEIDNRTGFFTGLGSLLLFIGKTIWATISGAFGQTKECTTKSATRVASGTKKRVAEMEETPGARRIYGYCPVSFDIEPKWFQELGPHVGFSEEDDGRIFDVGLGR